MIRVTMLDHSGHLIKGADVQLDEVSAEALIADGLATVASEPDSTEPAEVPEVEPPTGRARKVGH